MSTAACAAVAISVGIGAVSLPIASAASAPKLTWAPPVLDNPVQLTITNNKTTYVLDDALDYNIKLKGVITKNVTIQGGRNVVLIGGEIAVDNSERPLQVKMQRKSIHVEGVHLAGKNLQEGIDIDERYGAVTQVQNLLVDPITGIHDADHHADILQAWGGPAVMRVDRLEGTSNYQCMMFQPNMYKDDANPLKSFKWDIRNVVSRGGCAYFSVGSYGMDVTMTNVLNVNGKANQGAGAADLDVTRVTSAPSPLIGTPGVNYVSPGYEKAFSPSANATITSKRAANPGELAVSAASDRSNPQRLYSATIAGDQYIFIRSDAGITQVDFYVDDTNMRKAPQKSDTYAPWDLIGMGTTSPYLAKTASLSPGWHTITAVVHRGNAIETQKANFTIK